MSPSLSTSSQLASRSGASQKLLEKIAGTKVHGSVVRAMAHVPRERFVPEHEFNLAFEDIALPIGHGQTISQPTLVAIMTDALGLDGSRTVLEVGTGCGYQTAILAEL